MTNDSDDDCLKTGGALGVFADVAGQGDEAFIGRDLGDYRITGLIAEGGMSRVYRAERTDGSFERQVAIKVSPVSGFNDRMRERFIQEQGVLAGLNHPNISQLYDAQVTEEGWPYIVMELVDGGAIDEFCKDENNSIDDRVRLLIDIVDAVAYAHARLVVHRDIKPNNVLVNEDGRPKLLDFGIAKLLEGEERDLTKAGPMTPRYASPEQLLGQPITTASDIYQLGLLFYQVLAGEALNAEESLTDAIQRAAGDRPLSIPPAQRTALPRELVVIIEQCLRVSADERYRDVNALKGDLQAYLDGYPVSAAGQNAGYRFRKFIGRNRPAALITAAAAVAIVGGSVWYTISITEARALAEERADAANRALQAMSSLISETFSGLFDRNAESGVGNSLFIESVLNDTMSVVEAELETQDSATIELYRLKASIEQILGDQDGTTESLDRAKALVDPDTDFERALQIDAALVDSALSRSQFTQARTMMDEIMVRIESAPVSPRERVRLELLDGTVYRRHDEYKEAEERYLGAIRTLEEELPDDFRLLAQAYGSLASLYNSWERYPDTIDAAQKAIDTLDANGSTMSHRLIEPLRAYGWAAQRIGKLDDARRVSNRALDIALANFGETHGIVERVYGNLASIEQNEGKLDNAVSLNRKRLEILGALYGKEAQPTIYAKSDLSFVLSEIGRLEEALQYNDELLETIKNSGQSEMRRAEAIFWHQRARILNAMQDFDSAVESQRQFYALRVELMGEENYGALDARIDLAQALARAGKINESEEHFEAALEGIKAHVGAEHRDYVMRSLRRFELDRAMGNIGDARDKLQEFIRLSQERREIDRPWWISLTTELAEACLQLDDPECAGEALALTENSVETFRLRLDAIHASIVRAEYLMRTGDQLTARKLAADALESLARVDSADPELRRRASVLASESRT